MRLEHKELFDVLYPSEGMYIALIDLSVAFEGELYLSPLDSIDNYIEVTDEEYNKINNKGVIYE